MVVFHSPALGVLICELVEPGHLEFEVFDGESAID